MSNLDDFMPRGAKSAFNKDSVIGETITGTVVDAVIRQVTNMQDGSPEFFPSGDPKHQVVVTLQTDLREDADDDGQRSLYIKNWGDQQKALMNAIRANGWTKYSEGLAAGNTLTATFTELRQHPKGGFPAKVYEYQLRPGARPSLDQGMPAQPAPAQAQMPNPWAQAPTQIPVQPATPPAPAPQAPAPAQQAAPVTAQAPSDPQAMIRAGWTDEQIGAATGLTPDVLAMLRQYVPQ